MSSPDPWAAGGPLDRAADRVQQDEARQLGVVKPKPAEIVPDFAARYDAAAQQMVDAMAVPEDDMFAFPWPGLHKLVGTLRPASIIVVAGYTGTGKTIWGLNLVSRMIDAGERPYILTAEEDASDYLLRLVAIRRQLPMAATLTNAWDKLPDGAASDLLEEAHELRERVVFAPDREISLRALARTFAEARQAKCDAVLIDHIHHGDRSYGATVGRMYQLRDLVLAEHLPVIALAQMRRDEGFVLASHVPPRIAEIEGGEVIAQCADLVLGLYWPLKPNANRAKLLKRQLDVRDCLVPGRIAVRVMKHRLDGMRRHSEAQLAFDAGRLSDPPETAQADLEDEL